MRWDDLKRHRWHDTKLAVSHSLTNYKSRVLSNVFTEKTSQDSSKFKWTNAVMDMLKKMYKIVETAPFITRYFKTRKKNRIEFTLIF
jgi:hypothetical protein